MKHILLSIAAILIAAVAQAQFSSVSTNIVGWAAGNINVAIDVNVNLTIQSTSPCRSILSDSAIHSGVM